jgi:hypothetical protein
MAEFPRVSDKNGSINPRHGDIGAKRHAIRVVTSVLESGQAPVHTGAAVLSILQQSGSLTDLESVMVSEYK